MHKRRHWFARNIAHLFALFIVALGLTGIASAQTTTGSIYGTVADASGAIIPKASVVASDVATGISHTAISNSSGDYVFPALDPGNYTVSTKVAGFKSVTQQGIVLSANQNVHASFVLVTGGVNQTVIVSAGTTLVDTRESQLAETVDQRRIEELPLNGRDVYDLVQLVPGVTNYTADTATGSRGGTTFSANGLPTDSSSYYIDGTSDQAFYQNGGDLLPNPDALQEFRLLTSNFDAEFGRAPGGVVNVITRSGTKSYHGMAYEYIRNDAFNSKAYFKSGPATPLKQNQFGGNFGGPIPLLPSGRAFVFLSYEQLIVHQPAVIGPQQITTATALERTGNFSQSTAPVKAELAKLFCGTQQYVICPNVLDPVAQNLLKFVPVEIPANGSTLAYTAQQSANAGTTANQGMGRIDYQLTPAHQLEAMFFNSRGDIAAPNIGVNQILSYSGMNDYENQVNAVLADTWTISPNTLNTLRGFYTQNRYIIGALYGTNNFLNSPNVGSQAGEGGVIGAPADFAVKGYWTMGTSGSGPNDNSQLSFGLMETMNLTRGRHNMKLGGSYIRSKFAATGVLSANGIFTFTGSATGNALADFLEGKANTLAQTGITVQRDHNYDPTLFFQDDWQATQRLSLNLGLRWEVDGPFTGGSTASTFHPYVQSKVFPTAPIGLLFVGDPGIPPGVFHTSYMDFAPRVGFAYDVFGSGRTSLRGGFGIFYELPRETNIGNLQNGQPYSLSVTTNKTPNLVTPYAPGVDPFPFVFNSTNPKFVSGATSTAAPTNGGATPYVEEYNLTVEQQLGKQWAMRVGYVGNAARKFYITHDINAPTYVPGASTASATVIDARRPYEPTPATYLFGTINENDPILNQGYNSLQTTLQGRIGSRLTVQASYVWSKDIDYEGPFVNGLDIKMNRGLATTDLRNAFSMSFLYSLPDVRLWGPVGKEVLSGWQVNDLTQLQSGSPFTVISGTDTNLDGVVNDRVNIVGNPYANAHTRAQKITEYLNPNSFATPTGPYGNEQNDSLIGPKFVNTNLSLFKMFPLYREAQLQFRAEAFNAFDNVNLGNPVANLITLNQDLAVGGIGGSAGVNQITSQVGGARILQFALKVLF